MAPDTAPADGDALSPRWRGQAGRLEVWYASLSDPATATGCWIHHETVAPLVGSAYTHGWVALFRPGSPCVLERFGPEPVAAVRAVGPLSRASGATFEPPALRGRAGRLGWDLDWVEDAGSRRPLFTFPAWAWNREILPAAAVVPVPDARFRGAITVDGTAVRLSPEARGAVGHIYGHGNAQRWGWLHAGLGNGDVLEVVSAVSRRPGLAQLPPLAFLQLRLGGHDWPRHPLLTAPVFRTELDLPTWRIRGTVGRWRLSIETTLPASGTVVVGYVDPDGARATCTNSEVADTDIVLEHRRRAWEVERQWHLRGTAHSEVGLRP